MNNSIEEAAKKAEEMKQGFVDNLAKSKAMINRDYPTNGEGAFQAAEQAVGCGVNIDKVHRPQMAHVQVEVPAVHSFMAALHHLIIARGHVSRVGWNGRGMHVDAQWPDANSKMGKPYLFIEDVYGVKTPWVPSQGDLFANDWALLPPGHVSYPF